MKDGMGLPRPDGMILRPKRKVVSYSETGTMPSGPCHSIPLVTRCSHLKCVILHKPAVGKVNQTQDYNNQHIDSYINFSYASMNTYFDAMQSLNQEGARREATATVTAHTLSTHVHIMTSTFARSYTYMHRIHSHIHVSNSLIYIYSIRCRSR